MNNKTALKSRNQSSAVFGIRWHWESGETLSLISSSLIKEPPNHLSSARSKLPTMALQ